MPLPTDKVTGQKIQADHVNEIAEAVNDLRVDVDAMPPGGYDAYEIDVAYYAYPGTREQWLEDQRGPAGTSGVTLGATAIDVDPGVSSFERVRELGANVAASGAVGDGTANDRPAIVAADAIGGVFLPAGSYRVATSLTVANPVQFAAGATIRPSSGQTVTLSGGIVAPPRQIFDLSAGGLVVVGNVADVLPEWWGAAGDGTTDDDAAIRAAVATGRPVRLTPGKSYRIAGATPLNFTRIYSTGVEQATVLVDASTTGLRYDPAGLASQYAQRGGIDGVRITAGPSGASAKGLTISNCFAFTIGDIEINNFTSGVGLYLWNRLGWTEGTTGRVRIKNCAVGIGFERTGGTFSYAYTNLEFNINVPANGIGIDLGMAGGSIYVYHSQLRGNFWLGSNSTGIKGRAGLTMEDTHVVWTGEWETGATGDVGVDFTAGTATVTGMVNMAAHSNIETGLRVLAFTAPVDGRSGADVDRTYEMVATANPDVSHTASFGFAKGTGIESPWVAMYSATGNRFAVKSVPFGSTPGAAPDVFFVSNNGHVVAAASISAGAELRLPELGAHPSPLANQALVYAVDNGAGKTRLMVRFATGGAVQLAIEP